MKVCLDKFSQQMVLVVGDMMVDKYIIGKVDRISPEAPIPVLRQKEVQRKLGGAGNVILNIKSFGAGVRVVGSVGNDSEGVFFRNVLCERGVDDSYLFEEGNTIIKTRVSAGHQQFIRIDEETIEPPTDTTKNKILDQLEKILQDITVVIVSDYAKGFITEDIVQAIISEAKKKNIPVLVDPKGKSAGKYRGATAITPNNKEFMDLVGLNNLPDEDGIRERALCMCESNDFEYIVFTRSEKGISVIGKNDRQKKDFPAVEKEVIDVTGAGDTVVSAIALALGSGFSIDRCVEIANIAASIVISRFGAAQTTVEEIYTAMNPKSISVLDLEVAFKEIEQLKKRGKRIVFTNGCFDLVHAGHISSFHQALEFGDVLVVGLNSDESIRRIKGDKRPIVGLKDRITLLTALSCVDIVIPFEEDTPQALIEKIKPDVLVKGKDWEGKVVAGAEFVRSYGGKVAFIELEQGLSTTNIIERIKQTMA